MLLVQAGNLPGQFCFEMNVERVAIQDQEKIIKKFLLRTALTPDDR